MVSCSAKVHTCHTTGAQVRGQPAGSWGDGSPSTIWILGSNLGCQADQSSIFTTELFQHLLKKVLHTHTHTDTKHSIYYIYLSYTYSVSN